MFGHYLPNKNEGATVDPKSKFRELNKGSEIDDGVLNHSYVSLTLPHIEMVGGKTLTVYPNFAETHVSSLFHDRRCSTHGVVIAAGDMKKPDLTSGNPLADKVQINIYNFCF